MFVLNSKFLYFYNRPRFFSLNKLKVTTKLQRKRLNLLVFVIIFISIIDSNRLGR